MIAENQLQHNLLPEAPFSTNAYFITTCGIKHQVTARGNSAQEMTTNYFAAVDSLKAAYAQRSRQRSIDAGKLLALVACWMKKAETLPGMALRLVKATQLVQAGAVERESEHVYHVQSQSAPDACYTVTACTCPCEDAQRHTDLPCKHVLATKLYAKLTAGA